MVLFLFEGKKPEVSYFQELCKKTNIDIDVESIISTYGTVIYQLYSELNEDKYLDLPALLAYTNKLNLDNIENFTEIYLFFDYDPHASNASDEKLKEMLGFFNNETEHGKLFISYPMIEALRHIQDNSKNVVCNINDCLGYKKKIIALIGIPNVDKLTPNEWMALIDRHLKIANNLVYDIDALPESIIEQNDIFNKQIEKHVKPHERLCVLSAIPLFYLDYMGTT